MYDWSEKRTPLALSPRNRGPVKGRKVYVVLCTAEESQFVANWKRIPSAILKYTKLTVLEHNLTMFCFKGYIKQEQRVDVLHC
jgi:hypothetical protein